MKYKIKLLWIDSEQEFTFCELNRKVIIQLNIKEGHCRVCQPVEVFGLKNIKQKTNMQYIIEDIKTT